MKYTGKKPYGINQTGTGSIAVSVENVDVASFTSGSLDVSGSLIATTFTASTALINGDVRIKGTASVDVLITSYESSSIIYSSGSTKFGDTLDDTHQFTGSVYITSSLDVTGGITGSLFGTASYANYVLQAETASYVNPLTQSVSVTGSLTVLGPSTLIGDTNIDGNLYPLGYSWTPVSSSNIPTGLRLRGVAYGDGKFVAVGDVNGASTQSIAYSYDGDTWETGSLPTLSSLTNITYQQGLFITIGRVSGRFYYSVDGLEWFPGTGAVNNQQYGITYGQDKFVSVGIDGVRFKYSYNGKEWFNTTYSESLNLSYTSVTYGNGRFVAVAETTATGSIAISEDGLNWTLVSRPAGFTTYTVAYGNGKFVVTCNTGKVLVSADGETWVEVQTPLTGLIWKIIYAEGLFIAAGSFSGDENKIIVSKDSITWEIIDTPSLNNWSGFAYGNGRLVAVSFTQVDATSRIIVSGNPIKHDIPSGNKYHGDTTFTSNLYTLESLQVGGSLSVSSSMQVRGSGTTSSTTALLVENANASASLAVNDAGNVLIGTTTDAGYKLDVNGNIRISGINGYIYGDTTTPYLRLSTAAGSFLGYSTSNIVLGPNFVYNGGGVARFRINTNGNVLIGTTTDAGYKLDVNGTVRVSGILYADSTINQQTVFGNKLLFMNSGNYSKIALADGTNWSMDYHSGTTIGDVGYHRFYTGGTSGWVERLIITNSGNVGIGTTAPSYKLDVSGSGNFTDNLTVTGSLEALGGITGSLFGTSSYALEAITASYALYAVSASYEIIKEESSSFADTASYVNPLVQDVEITGSLNIQTGGGYLSLKALGGGSTQIEGSSTLGLNSIGALDFYRNGVLHSRIANYTSNWLIGTTTDSGYKLDVSGSGNFTDGLTVTGSLTVSGSSTFTNIGPANFTESVGVTGETSLYKSGSTVLDVQGSQGQLFSVVDSLTGSLMSVNDISGLPILEVFSDDRVEMGTYGAPGLIVTGSSITATGSLFGTSSYALEAITASYALYAVSASYEIIKEESSSFADTASYVNPLVQDIEATGSLNFALSGLSGTSTNPLKLLGGGGEVRFDTTNTEYRAYSFNLKINSSYGGTGESALFSSYTYGGASPRIGIGTTTPSSKLHVKGSGTTSATTTLLIENANASASLTVLDNGYVGIGTGSAQYNLDVNGSARFITNTYINPTTNGQYPAYVIEYGGETRMVVGSNGSGGNSYFNGTGDRANLAYAAFFGSAAGYATQIGTYNGVNMTLLNNGNVGIGTINPAYTLDVQSPTQTGTGTAFNIFNVGYSNSTISAVTASSFLVSTTANSTNRYSTTVRIGGGSDTSVHYLRYGEGSANGLRLDRANNTLGIFTVNGVYISNTDTNTNPSGRLQVRGSGTTSATTAFLVENSSATAAFIVTDDRLVTVSSKLQVGTFTPGAATGSSTIFTTGRISAGGGITFYNPVNGDNNDTGIYYSSGLQIKSNNASVANFKSVGGNTSGYMFRVGGYQYNPSSGTGTVNTVLIDNNLIPSGINSANYNYITVAPTITQGSYGTGTIRGFYFAPNINSLNTSPLIAFQSTGGDVKFQGDISVEITGSTSIIGETSIYKSGSTVFQVQGSQGELFAITDSLSGSLFSVSNISGLPIMEVFSDNTTLMGDYLAPALMTTKRLTANSGSTVIYSIPTASYDGAFFEYTIKSGSNARAGQIFSTYLDTTASYTDNSTSDIGDTTGFIFGVILSGSNMVLTGSASTDAWTVKTIIRSI